MEVPSAVLEKLVCERCNGYLSRGPVHLLENTKYRCGRCLPSEEEDGTRVEAYEELAQLMSFPCAYQKYGCRRKVQFRDNKRHEEACPFREYSCPVTESGECDWTGPHTEVLEHCQQDHPTKVYQQDHQMKVLSIPCTFTYDITRPSLNNYVLFAFEVLFLIQTKVCTETQKIYHAVRLIGDPLRACDFKFTLELKNKLDKLIKQGDVAPRGLLVLQEDTSVVTGINSLQEMLGDFKDITFTVTIESSGQETSRSSTLDHVTPPVQTLEVKVQCGECWTETEPVYRGDWLCREHARKIRECKNKTRGCTYTDIQVKCEKHQLYHCDRNKFGISCSICSKNINRFFVDKHYTEAHSDVTHRAGTVFTVTLEEKWLIIECDFGRVACRYLLCGSAFALEMYTPLPSAQLYKYRCTVELSYPDTGHTLTRTATLQYNNQEDWDMCFPLSVYKAYVHNNQLNIKINITKIYDPSKFIL